jgi:hypothetical protein
MITKALGIPNFYFYTNFEPVFSQMQRFTNSYSRLLQTNGNLPNPRTAPLPRQPLVQSRRIDVVG